MSNYNTESLSIIIIIRYGYISVVSFTNQCLMIAIIGRNRIEFKLPAMEGKHFFAATLGCQLFPGFNVAV